MNRLTFGGTIAIGAFLVGGGLFLFSPVRTLVIAGPDGATVASSTPCAAAEPCAAPGMGAEEVPASTSSVVVAAPHTSGDIEAQKPLPNPPDILRGIYVTAWVAGSEKRMASLIDFMKQRGLNAAVVDIKDYSGFVSYAMDVPAARESGAESELRIARPNALVKSLHDAGIYAIARVTAFQDPIFAKARPDLAVHRISAEGLWEDRKGLAWLDAAGQGSWEYIAAVGRDAANRGFDEINFDYVRFPSDGNMADAKYPFWDRKTPRHEVLASFFSYLRSALPNVHISADLFGLTTVAADDLGIGQKIDDAYANFDGVYPMIYPSHFAAGANGYKDPAAHPYEIIRYSMDGAIARLFPKALPAASGTVAAAPKVFTAKIRPWLQVFDLGATYDRAKIDAQIKATEDAFAQSAHPEAFAGWFLWDPKNTYLPYR